MPRPVNLQLALIMLLAATASSGCRRAAHSTAPTPPTESGRYVNEVCGYSIRFPPDWPAVERGNAVVATRPEPVPRGGPADRQRIEVVTVTLPRAMTLDQFRQRDLGLAGVGQPEGAELLEQGLATLDGTEARWALLAVAQDSAREVWRVWWVVRDARGYKLLGKADAAEFDRFKATFQQTVDSFRLVGDGGGR